MTGARLLDPPGQCNGVRSQCPAWPGPDAHADGRTESVPSSRGNRGETRPWQTGVVTGTQELTRDEWAEMASRSFVPLAVRRVAHSFSGRIERRTIGPGLSLSRVVAGACELERTPELIGGSAAGDFLVSLQLTGSGTVHQHGRVATMGAGAGALYKTDRPYLLSFRTDTVSLVSQISIERLGLGSATVNEVAARTLTPRNNMFRVYTAFAKTVFGNALSMTEAERDSVEFIAGELLRAALNSHLGSGTLTDAPTQLVVLRHFIHEHASEACLDVASLAAAHGISVRQVQKLFVASGTTPAEYIRVQRTRAARLLLVDHALSMVDVAFRSGFADVSTFGRVFKRTHGMTPTEWRRQRCGPGTRIVD